MNRLSLLMGFLLVVGCAGAHAIEVRVTAPAIERTLQHQLFNQADADGKLDRHYLKGNATRGCAVYADEPHVSFKDDRVVVDVKIHAKLGFGKACFGVTIATESEVSFVPEAQGESVGFRDAHVDHLTNNHDLDVLLEPFLSKKLPQEMKVNAADLMRNLLVKAPDSTGYRLTLETLALHSMQVAGDVVVVDLDADFLVD